MVVLEERPFKIDVTLNSSNESEEKNFLKMKLTFEIPPDYPNSVPLIRMKNLTPEIIHNNLVLEFERLVAQKSEESVGTQMLYEVCETLRD